MFSMVTDLKNKYNFEINHTFTKFFLEFSDCNIKYIPQTITFSKMSHVGGLCKLLYKNILGKFQQQTFIVGVKN